MERLQQLKNLLKIEREEDLKQYKEHFSRNNLSHRKKSGVTWYPIIIINSEYGFGDYLNIEIERTSQLNEPHQFTGGKTASVFSQAQPDAPAINGTIKVLGPNKLRLTLNTDELPDWCDEGKLGINLLFDETGYREMDAALDRVLFAKNNRLAELRDIIYGLKAPYFTPILETETSIDLNQSQQFAVDKVIAAKDIALIHGPPGTGKTTTLVKAILSVLKTEKQVLVCSASNTAVDLLTEKLHFSGIKVLRMGNPARVSEEILMNTLDAKVAAHPSYKDLKNYKKTAEEYFRMAGKYKRTFGREDREQRQLLYQEAKKIMSESKFLEDYIVQDQLNSAQVIACTPVVAGSKILRDKQFNTLFFDEAAQALEPMCWIPISRCNRVVFAGDHLQLPPTVKSKKAEAGGLKETIFERCMQIEGISMLLDTQYRMNASIMNYSNAQFYNNKLHAHESVKNAVLDVGSDNEILNNPLTFMDTAGCSFDENINPESLSISNKEEALLLLKHLRKLYTAYILSPNFNRRKTIGIISPYKEQVELLQKMIEEDEILRKSELKITVKTIDGFQGQERSIIYISLVRSNSSKEIGFLSDTRRMNVALTRAREKLVVIGDSGTISNHDFYKNFIEFAESQNAYQSAWELMD